MLATNILHFCLTGQFLQSYTPGLQKLHLVTVGAGLPIGRIPSCRSITASQR